MATNDGEPKDLETEKNVPTEDNKTFVKDKNELEAPVSDMSVEQSIIAPSQPLKETQNKPPDVGKAPAHTRSSVGQLGQPATIQLTVDQQLNKLKRDLETMVLKYAKSENENLQNQRKVEELDKKLKRVVKDNDQLANRIKLLTNDKNQLTDTLNAKVAQLTVLEQKNSNFNQEQVVKLKDYVEQIKKLEGNNEELLKQIESYKSKEGELLDFCERLSMKHMMLQTELDEAAKKVPNFKDDYEAAIVVRDRLIKERDKLTEQIQSLNECLKTEQLCSKSLREELELKESKYRNQMDELQNEIKVIRRKHQLASKELIKEVKQLRAQLEKVGGVHHQQ